MALVRILVDGYSLLHSWPELAPGKARHSMAARDGLIAALTQYQDAIGTPITVIFDGAGAPKGTPPGRSTPEMEVLYSKAGQTADDLIERVTHRLLPYGEVLVVTDDLAERETVGSLGASTAACDRFITQIHHALKELRLDLGRLNERERRAFRRGGPAR
jgi:predicted RNA-binding protein with PIN domain